MELRTTGFTEHQTMGRQRYLSRSQLRMSVATDAYNILVPGACTCCEGSSSCTCAW
jgi:hypothetical protein